MAPRAKVSAKVAVSFHRHRDFLVDLTPGPMSVLVIQARGQMTTARELEAKGFLQLTPDVCSLLPAGREWLKEVTR